jgi:hypothetical protein
MWPMANGRGPPRHQFSLRSVAVLVLSTAVPVLVIVLVHGTVHGTMVPRDAATPTDVITIRVSTETMKS